MKYKAKQAMAFILPGIALLVYSYFFNLNEYTVGFGSGFVMAGIIILFSLLLE